MLISPGIWSGRGSWRVTTDSTGMPFDATVEVDEYEQGLTIAARVQLEQTLEQLKFDAWVVPDESGLYTVTLQGPGLDILGTAKLESLPHLGLLNSREDDVTLAVTIFESREVNGVRGFYRQRDHMYTFEFAFRETQAMDTADNIVAFQPRRRS